MRQGRRCLFLPLSAAILVAVVAANADAAAVAAVDVRAGRGWMPDVAARIAALRERARRAGDDARLRRDANPRSGQWWRVVAAAPPAERPR